MRMPEKEKIQKLLDKGLSNKEIAKHFNRKSESTVVWWLKKYNLKSNRPSKRWNKEDKQFVIDNYPKMGAVFCSEKLDRSLDSIYKFVSENNIKKNSEWKKFDKELLKKEYLDNRLSVEKIAEKYSSTPGVIYYALIENNIEIDKSARYYGHKHFAWKGYEEISGGHWCDIRKSAKRRSRKIEFNITIEEAWDLYIKQNRKCALSGVDIWFSPIGGRRHKKTTASLDRIDSSLGYSVDNCQWVHKEVNMMKMSLKEEKFIKWCELIFKNKGSNK